MSNVPYRHIEKISTGVYQCNDWTIHYDFQKDSILEIVDCRSTDTDILLDIDTIYGMFGCGCYKDQQVNVGFTLLNPAAKLTVKCQRNIKNVNFTDDFYIECDTLKFSSLLSREGSVILNGHVNVNHLILPDSPSEETFWPTQPLLIAPRVFQGSSLKDICNTDCICFIGCEAFADCKELKRVYLQIDDTDIQPNAFKNSGVEDIRIVTKIGKSRRDRFTQSAFEDTPAYDKWLEYRKQYTIIGKRK